MRRVRGRAEWLGAALALLLGGVPTAFAADGTGAATGVPRGLGAGAAALADVLQGTSGNPALLLGSTRLDIAAGLGIDAGRAPLQRLTLVRPASTRTAFALGYSRVQSQAGFDTAQRQEWSLAGAAALAGPLHLGGALKLRDVDAAGVSSPSFGIDLGVHATTAALGPATHLDVGVWFQNVVRPRRWGSDVMRLDTRGVVAAAACSRDLAGWRATGTLGLESATDANGAPWLGARLVGPRRIEFAFSSRFDAWGASVGVRRGSAGLEYGFASAAGGRHSIVLHHAFGTTALERRLAEEKRLETEVATRLARQMEAREAQQVGTWLEEGRMGLAAGEFEPAAERFRNVLLWRPDHEDARAGLRRAQLGTMLQQADSLVARHDYWSASSALEHAVRLFPEDSLATSRLQDVRKVVDRADRSRSEAAEQFRLGLDAFATQHYAAAIRCFEAVHKLDTGNAVAVEFAQRSKQALEAQVQTFLQQARGRLERRDAESARSALLSALDAAPGNVEATRLLAQVDRDLERLAQERRVAESRRQEAAAREDRAPSAVAMPRLTSTYQRGMALYRAGDLTSAMLAWEDVARQAPHFEEVDQYLLRVYRVVGLESYTEGRLQNAIEIWSKALRLEPENPQVRRYMDQANAKLTRAQGPRGSR